MAARRRNSSGQFQRCVSAVRRSGSAYDPNAVCAASERRRGLINPASYRGKSVADLERMRVYAQARAYDNDWLIRDRGRRDVEAIDKALKNARKREAKKGNPVAFIVQPSTRRAGMWDLFVGGIHRVTKPTKAGAIGYAKRIQKSSGDRSEIVVRGNPLPLAAAEALETQALTPYQKKATSAAKGLQKKLGLKLNKGKRRRKNPRNPADAAAGVYEGFHGRPSTETIEITTRVHEHVHVAGLGELIALYIDGRRGKVKVSGFETKNGNPAFLTSNEKRTQLYIDGGDQRVNLDDFGIRNPIHESEVLGELVSIEYYTVKDHLGREGGEAVYHHKFKKSCRPEILYDTRNGLLSLSGGDYTIEDEGITN